MNYQHQNSNITFESREHYFASIIVGYDNDPFYGIGNYEFDANSYGQLCAERAIEDGYLNGSGYSEFARYCERAIAQHRHSAYSHLPNFN